MKQHFLSLNYPLPSEQVGHKFANLGKIAKEVDVPPAICVTVDVFKKSLNDDKIQVLNQFFEELRATVGCFLLSSYPELNKKLEGLEIPTSLQKELRDKLEETFGYLEGRKFAVRSSGVTEDTEKFSFAGIYDTKLNVEGFEEICKAIVECWLAYYSYTAIAARVRAEQFDGSPGMALIIQEMVPSELSGVAFTNSDDNDVIVEYVEGLGEQLVSGVSTPKLFRLSDDHNQIQSEEQKIMQQVSATALRLQQVFNGAVDIEWAWASNKLSILQARPVTVHLQEKRTTEPVFLKAELYTETTLPIGLELGECGEVYTSYVTKRAPSYRLAATNGVPIAAAHIIHFNGAGILGDMNKIEELLNCSQIPNVVLDISSSIRQVVLPKGEVLNYLRDTLALTPTSLDTHTIIIRDFIRGDYGFISRPIGEDSNGLLIEYSKEGLLDINRGLAHCERIILTNGNQPAIEGNLSCTGDVKDLEEFRTALSEINNFTQLMNKQMGKIQLEWVLDQGIPYFVDFSREEDEVLYNNNSESVVMAKGVASGPVFCLSENEDMLYRLSIGPAVSVDKTQEVFEHDGLQKIIHEISSLPQKPIIYVQRPYAVLSTLFEHVAGFVFFEGSLLCHLAILLRESKLPAVINSKFVAQNGEEVMIADGSIQIIQNY